MATEFSTTGRAPQEGGPPARVFQNSSFRPVEVNLVFDSSG